MRTIVLIILVLLGLFLLIEAEFSLNWPIAHDEAPLFYEAFLMRAEGRLPYRDLFDFQLPGAYAAFYLLGLLSRFDPMRIRILDLMLLSSLLGVTFMFMSRHGWKPALAGILIFGLKYLEGGPSMALQREYLLLIPMALGIWVFSRKDDPANGQPFLSLGRFPVFMAGQPYQRYGLVGVCVGLAATIKPQAAIGLLPFIAVTAWEWNKSRDRNIIPELLSLGLGFFIPILVMLFWLSATGLLKPFLDIAINYWPLYSQINGQLVVTTGTERWVQVLDQFWRLGGNGIWLIPAAAGVYLILRSPNLPDAERRKVLLYLGMMVSFAIYPALSGQFFEYHYLPFLYFVMLVSSLCMVKFEGTHWQAGGLAALAFALVIATRPSMALVQQLQGKPAATVGGRDDKITAYLASHLKPGDTVQPLDWTGGTLQAMLATRATLATSFVFDFYFYHHVSDPYIQGLRDRFIDEMQLAKPTYIIEVTAMDKPWVAGADTSREFPELRAYISENYVVDVQRDDSMIYRKR